MIRERAVFLFLDTAAYHIKPLFLQGQVEGLCLVHRLVLVQVSPTHRADVDNAVIVRFRALYGPIIRLARIPNPHRATANAAALFLGDGLHAEMTFPAGLARGQVAALEVRQRNPLNLYASGFKRFVSER